MMSSALLSICCTRLSRLTHSISATIAVGIYSRSVCSKRTDDSSSSSDDEPEKTKADKNSIQPTAEVSRMSHSDKQRLAKERLTSLLSELKVEDSLTDRKKTQLNLARPVRNKTKRDAPNQQKVLNNEEKLELAAKDIFKNVSPSKEVETDLLGNISLKVTKTEGQKQSIEIDEKVEQNIVTAVKTVASTVVDDDTPPVQSELTKKLLSLAMQKDPSSAVVKRENLINIVGGLKVEKTERFVPVQKPGGRSREYLSEPLHKRMPMRSPSEPVEKHDLFGSPPLNIFKTEELKGEATSVELLLWYKLQEKELKSLVQFAPSNPFEEMIQLTEQGKHWKFPIDNEIDMGKEKNIGFHEHVFLDHLLEGFPEKGPIRHFMELVVTGLTKNPYITVERKKENIEWFRQYFKKNEAILKQYNL